MFIKRRDFIINLLYIVVRSLLRHRKKTMVAARKSKRRVRICLTKAGNTIKINKEAESQRKRRSAIKLTVEEKYEKARVEDERRSAIKLTGEQKSEKARVGANKRRSVIKLTSEQKSEKARVEAERRIAIKLAAEQKFEKARVKA